jgi:hypothetical protein
VTMSNNNALIGTLLRICSKLTIAIGENSTDMVDASKITLMLSMKFIDRQELFRSIAMDKYVDWALVPSNTSKTNMLGESMIWLEFMRFMDFGHLDISESTLQSEYPPLWCIYDSLKQNKVLNVVYAGTVSDTNKLSEAREEKDGVQQLGFDDVCKLCILNNIIGLQSKTITEQYLATRLKRSTFGISSSILSAFADERHSADVYLKTMRYLLMKLNVDHHTLYTNVLYYNQAHENMNQTRAIKYAQNR